MVSGAPPPGARTWRSSTAPHCPQRSKRLQLSAHTPRSARGGHPGSGRRATSALPSTPAPVPSRAPVRLRARRAAGDRRGYGPGGTGLRPRMRRARFLLRGHSCSFIPCLPVCPRQAAVKQVEYRAAQLACRDPSGASVPQFDYSPARHGAPRRPRSHLVPTGDCQPLQARELPWRSGVIPCLAGAGGERGAGRDRRTGEGSEAVASRIAGYRVPPDLRTEDPCRSTMMGSRTSGQHVHRCGRSAQLARELVARRHAQLHAGRARARIAEPYPWTAICSRTSSKSRAVPLPAPMCGVHPRA